MAVRRVRIDSGAAYHIFNKAIGVSPIFLDDSDYYRFLWLLILTNLKQRHLSPSRFFRLDQADRVRYLKQTEQSPRYVEIYAYALMPNHFHLAVRQLTDGGASKFLSDLQNSYAKYLNTKHKTSGPVFRPRFRAVKIKEDVELIQVARYIMLNPYTAYIIKEPQSLTRYNWTSLKEYLTGKSAIGLKICQADQVLGLAFFNNDLTKLRDYVLDRADYQRELHKYRHLYVEE